MTNQQLMDKGNQMMDETDQAIDRAKKVVHETINVGADTAATLKAQTEKMSRVVNELDSIHFSIKKASKLVKELGRQVATDKCIMALLFLIVLGVVVIIIVKVNEYSSLKDGGLYSWGELGAGPFLTRIGGLWLVTHCSWYPGSCCKLRSFKRTATICTSCWNRNFIHCVVDCFKNLSVHKQLLCKKISYQK